MIHLFPARLMIVALIGLVLTTPASAQIGGGGGVSCMMCFMSTCQETGTDSGWEGCRVEPTLFCRPSNIPGQPDRCKEFDACETFGSNCLEPGSGGPTYALSDIPKATQVPKASTEGRAVPPPERVGDHIILDRHRALQALIYDTRVPSVLGGILSLGIRLGPTQGYITERESTPDGVALGERSYSYQTHTDPVDAIGTAYTMSVTFSEVDRRGRDLKQSAHTWKLAFHLVDQRVTVTEQTGDLVHFEVDASKLPAARAQ